MTGQGYYNYKWEGENTVWGVISYKLLVISY
jgi:hypothetical protein